MLFQGSERAVERQKDGTRKRQRKGSGKAGTGKGRRKDRKMAAETAAKGQRKGGDRERAAGRQKDGSGKTETWQRKGRERVVEKGSGKADLPVGAVPLERLDQHRVVRLEVLRRAAPGRRRRVLSFYCTPLSL